MYDQYESSYTIPPTASRMELGGVAFEPASPWLWASQLREALGENGELDAKTLEESWASGLPIRLEAFPLGREDVRAVTVGPDSFAELSGFGSFFMACADTLPKEQGHCTSPTYASSFFTANWPRDPVKEVSPQNPKQASASADCWRAGSKVTTYQGACNLLCVAENCTETQIKAAYRRMVRAWHPDRLAGSDESARTFATEKMTAINEAYHLLRETALQEVR